MGSQGRRVHGTPRIVDKMAFALSMARRVDGIWIGSFRRNKDDLERVEGALLLVKQHSPLHYSRIVNELERIWVSVVSVGLAQYDRSLKACVLDELFVDDTATTVARIASTIVHEATHARLERCGIAYNENRRARIEAICFRRELAFAVRLPDSPTLQQDIAQYLDWYQANPDYFGDAQFRERTGSGEVEAIRYLGAPNWLIRAMPSVKAVIDRTRKILTADWPSPPITRPPGSRPAP
jgi:hypothetical protein